MTTLSLADLSRDLSAAPNPAVGSIQLKPVMIDPAAGQWGEAPHLVYRTSDGRQHDIQLSAAMPLAAGERNTERSTGQ